MNAVEVATSYLRAGICVLPALLEQKRPSLSGWKQYQQRLPTELQVRTWFANKADMCILAGAVSGNLEMIDFDHGGELFERWCDLVRSADPSILDRLVVEQSQSGGRHVVYRCESPVEGNRKLAQRIVACDNEAAVVIAGKQYIPRRIQNRYEVAVTLIETRGEGGLFLCDPTPGYQLQHGSFDRIPILRDDEHALLIDAARMLTESLPPLARLPQMPASNKRPGDEFNERGDVRGLLLQHGWTLVRQGDNEYWRRPGKDSGWSATLRDRVLFVFSSNAAPFEPDRSYSPFAVYAMLSHSGDFGAAAVALRSEGYGEPEDLREVDFSRIVHGKPATRRSKAAAEHPDPGPLPLEMFQIPGFVAEVMAHTLETAPYPNVPLAFCGALALQAMLAGRKVRDSGDNRTNMYMLALAYSAVGKDWPRKVNTFILHKVGLVDALGEKFASGEGIQDALFRTPSMLFQTDEIDGLLQSINKSQDARHENILGTLLTMYSSANSIFPMRRKAGKDSAGVIDQPNLVVYGTAIPTHYYAALSERMLTNGFFARMLIVESGSRSNGQEPGIIRPPESVLKTANWWSEFCPGTGNLERFHPQPHVVATSDEARELLKAARQSSELEYAASESRGDPVGTTVWGRVPEQIRKLALLYAVSAKHENPLICAEAVRWATCFVEQQTRRMLFMAHSHVAENPFHAECLRLQRKLREAPDQTLAHSVLLKRMKMDARTFQELISTLEQQGDISVVSITRSGSAHRAYQLTEGGCDESVKADAEEGET